MPTRKKIRSRYWLLIPLFFILILGGIYFVQTNTNNNSNDLTDVTVRLSWVHQGQFAGMYVARELGFYEEAGLNVELLELDPDIDQNKEINEGTVEFSVMEGHQVLSGIGNGMDVTVVMGIYQINPHCLAVREDSDIYTPEDFVGKVVGLSGGIGEGNSVFSYFLESQSVADSVTYKELGFNTVENFINNEADIIDVYSIDQPYLAAKQGMPLRLILLDAYGFATYGDVLVVQNNYLADHPDLVAAFVQATKKGWEYTTEHQDEAIAITLPYTSGDYHDEDYQRHIILQSVPLIRSGDAQIGEMNFVTWSRLYEAMASTGQFSQEFDIQNVYTNEFLYEQ